MLLYVGIPSRWATDRKKSALGELERAEGCRFVICPELVWFKWIQFFESL